MTATVGGRHQAGLNAVLAVLLVSGVVYALTQTLVGPALPELATTLDVSPDTVSWLFTGFLLTAAVATPLIGRYGDMHDRGRVLAVVLAIFAAGGVLCATTTSFPVVLAGRLLQGVAGGVLPLAYGLVKDLFPKHRVDPSIGLLGTTFGVGGGIGLPLSGILVDAGDVRLIFLSSLFALPAAVGAWICIPRRATPVVRRKIDIPGTLLMSLGLSLLLLGLSRTSAWGLASPVVWALIVAGLLSLHALVRVELRTPDPLIDVRVLGTRSLLLVNVITLLIGLNTFANFLLTPQFAQADGYGFGMTGTMAGSLMLPSAAATMIGGPLASRLGGRFGGRFVLVVGALCACFSTGLLGFAHGSPAEFLLAGAFMGLGGGFVLAASASMTVAIVDDDRTGVATGINTVARTIGASLGAVLLSTVLSASAVGDGPPTESGFTVAYLLGAAAALVAAGLGLLLPGRRRLMALPAGSLTASTVGDAVHV